jgi:ribosome-binding ATPase
METAVIGLPASGKTTIFNALTGQQASLSEFAGARKQMHLAEVQVPDARVDKLTALFHPKKTVYATVLFRDVPIDYDPETGISAASIADIRKADAVTLVIRAFLDESVPHPLKSTEPLRDFRKVLDALVFADLEVADKRRERLEKEGKRDSREYHILERILEKLGSGSGLGTGFLSEDEEKLLSGFSFLTLKPLIVVLNSGEKSADLKPLLDHCTAMGIACFPIRGDLEMEIAQLPPADQVEFLKDIGLSEPAKNRFLAHVYGTLKLISFLTAGVDEVRAWSIHEGTPAVKAAGKIHSDLEKGFIRAEVVPCQVLLDCGGDAEAKKLGKIRLEGKEYIVKDGDVIVIRFNK